jgi:hypothetical protein
MKMLLLDDNVVLVEHGDSLCHCYIEAANNHDGPIFDADGEQIGTMRVEIKTPELILTADQKAMLKARHDACADCPAATDLTDTTVTCRRCRRCKSKKNLLHVNQTCPEGRWPR